MLLARAARLSSVLSCSGRLKGTSLRCARASPRVSTSSAEISRRSVLARLFNPRCNRVPQDLFEQRLSETEAFGEPAYEQLDARHFDLVPADNHVPTAAHIDRHP